ncbi:helix-turn-helix transcriptional regulator [Leuconostoc carnosum]|uniref:helix-turn-helix domain-containing protein n=1 Tax=Leuconostoc TaxID=1243 RepID=UPI000D50C766|nr:MULTISPECIES: helix-turn-helix transcriptional regulator [Leuconostoc]KAA8324412.1 helix-turn-helix transcriptional regulator [Leuconostoc carnosum]KAA8358084.1 helix-turn-helix transcriptional regulator [Leuconostoc carnosum]KAA8364582.1 helix-turn-helix transcriptional regulator [Leuconostoc carnosum]KAA8365456.1 helix-turn-helix transcriptional regulator [Leuconostoc carnosum]KAA8371486.1 helix-turn-helix transcriptional regulator [Leuconostoc carnosum]
MLKKNKSDSFDGQVIRDARKKMHLSQVELAEGITTQATISLVENQDRVPNADVLLAILDRLNLDISQFVSGDFLTQKAKELLARVVLQRDHNAIEEFHEFEKALSQNSPTLQAYYILKASDAHNQHDFANGVYYAEKAVDRNTPSLGDFYLFYAYNRMGVCCYENGDIETAKEKFKLAYDLEPDLFTASELEFHGALQGRKAYAEFLIAQNELDKAADILTEALQALRQRADLFWVSDLSELLSDVEKQRGNIQETNRQIHIAHVAAYLTNHDDMATRLSEKDIVNF